MWQGWIHANYIYYTAPFKNYKFPDLELHFQISKLEFRFQINSNGFGQECLFFFSNVCRLSFSSLENFGNCCASKSKWKIRKVDLLIVNALT